jgi:hypothetical protein
MDWNGWEELLKALGAFLHGAGYVLYGVARLVSELRRWLDRRR